MKRNAFTLVELLVVIAIIAVLVAILVPVIGSALAEARAASCQANLKTIAGAFREYSRKNATFARLNTTGTAAGTYVAADTKDVCDATLAKSPMTEVWALIGAGLLYEAAFKCGGDSAYTTRVVGGTTLKYGWSADTQFSYGIQFPYTTTTTVTEINKANPAIDPDLTNGMPANGILMADMAKRATLGPVTDAANYQNHSGSGICYVTGAGNATMFKGTTSVVNGDEIYADAVAGGGIVPGAATDTVICPGSTKKT